MASPHTTPLCGLILAGGQSRRMGANKALINYHGLPQAEYAYQLLSAHCESVFLACGEAPIAGLSKTIPQIQDAYQDIGPLAGILSAMEAYSKVSWLVLACDMPWVDDPAIRCLLRHRNVYCDATVFQGLDGFLEPLLAVYEPTCLPRFQKGYETGQTGLRFLLNTLKTEIITHQSLQNHSISRDFLRSINTPQQAEEWRKFQRKHS